MAEEEKKKRGDFLKLLASIALPLLVGTIGSYFTAPAIPEWYAGLNKPALNPPNWVFAPAWTTLYILMGVSLFLIWRKGIREKRIKMAVFVFITQLVLNATWSIAFFGAQNPGLALINIILLWIGIICTIILFYKIFRVAAYLLIPYLLWTSFATYLNYSILILN